MDFNKRSSFLSIAMLFLAILIALPSSAPVTASAVAEKPIIFTTFYPLTILAQQIVNDSVTVESFMPEGIDPMNWQPTDADFARLEGSELFLANGAGLEPWLPALREARPDMEIIVLSKGFDLIKLKSESGESDYKVRYTFPFDIETYLMDFGHTHEPYLQIGFMKSEGLSDEALDQKGKLLMALDPIVIPQEETVAIENGAVYHFEMGHESGKIFLSFPEAGDWAVYIDRISTDNLPYLFVNPSDEIMEPATEWIKADEDMQIEYDPYIWLSFSGTRHYAKLAARTIAAKYPETANITKDNRSAINKALINAAKEFDAKFEKVENRKFAAMHPAFNYLAREFRLKQINLSELDTVEASTIKNIELDTITTPLANNEDISTRLIDNAEKLYDTLSAPSARIAPQPIPVTGGEDIANQEPVMENDIYLEDWEGTWDSLGAFVDMPEMQEEIAAFATSEKKTVAEVKELFEKKRHCDYSGIVVDADTVAFYDKFVKDEADKPIAVGEYEYVGTYQVYHGRFKTDWYAFHSVSPDVPAYLLMMPVHGEESLAHTHIRYGDELRPLLTIEDWFPTFVIQNATPEQLIKGFTE